MALTHHKSSFINHQSSIIPFPPRRDPSTVHRPIKNPFSISQFNHNDYLCARFAQFETVPKRWKGQLREYFYQ
jgi:hypothetical protein